jgi:hypothetical protein
MEEVKQELRRCTQCKCTVTRDDNFELNRKDEWYKTCNGCRAKGKAWREANREKAKAGQKTWREANLEKAKAGQKTWREANSEKLKADHKAWREANLDKINERIRQYRANGGRSCEHKNDKYRCHICDPGEHLRHIVSSRVRGAMKAEKDKGSLEYLGCDIEAFRKHITDQFKDNMTWENYGEWEIDHIIPIKYKKDGIPSTLEEVAERLHYTNTQPLWKHENMAKGNRFIG